MPPLSTPSASLPLEDQQVTIVSVRNGAISVLPARALVVRPSKIALSLDAPSAEVARWEEGQGLTLLYTQGEQIMRLRAELCERIADDRVAVEPIGEAKEGDRRDFRRADIDVRIRARRVATRDSAAAREAQLAAPVALESTELAPQRVNLSGSGVSFIADEVQAMDDLVDVRMVLNMEPPRLVQLIGRVVRAADPAQPDSMTAVRFAEMSEADQDALIYSVFAAHFASVGLDADAVPLVDDAAMI